MGFSTCRWLPCLNSTVSGRAPRPQRRQKAVPPQAVAPTAPSPPTTGSSLTETAAVGVTREASEAAGALSPSTLTHHTTRWCACRPVMASRGSGETPSVVTWWRLTRRATSTACLCSARTTSRTTGTTGRFLSKQTRSAPPPPAAASREELSCLPHLLPPPLPLCPHPLNCLHPLFHLHRSLSRPRPPCHRLLLTLAPLKCQYPPLILPLLTCLHPLTHHLGYPPLFFFSPHKCLRLPYRLLPHCLIPLPACLHLLTRPAPACSPLLPTLTCWLMATARLFLVPPPCLAGPPSPPTATPSRSITTRPCRMRGCYERNRLEKTVSNKHRLITLEINSCSHIQLHQPQLLQGEKTNTKLHIYFKRFLQMVKERRKEAVETDKWTFPFRKRFRPVKQQQKTSTSRAANHHMLWNLSKNPIEKLALAQVQYMSVLCSK